jgi:hypothetical protein
MDRGFRLDLASSNRINKNFLRHRKPAARIHQIDLAILSDLIKMETFSFILARMNR